MKKLEEWKEFQADNLAKSSVVAIASTALNVWVQKSKMFATGFGKMTNQPEWEPNAHSWKAVAVSKISGAVITMATMMGLRFALPKTTKEWDEELSERYFTPLIRKTQKLFGAEVTPEQASPAETLEYSAASVKEPAPAVMSGEHEHRHSADKRHKHDDSHRARHESKKHHSRTGMVEKTREEAPHLGKA